LKATKKTTPPATVRADHNRHTCIEVRREGGIVHYVPLSIDGFELCTLSVERFDSTYDPLPDYPVDRAAKLYTEYATQLGGSLEAMQALAVFTTVTQKDIDMATTKKAAAAAKTPPVKKPVPAKKPIPGRAPKAALAPKAAKASKVPKAAGEKKPSAATMFKELIMEGKLTDAQIFAKVQKEYGLDDNKRSYVKWYRNDLVKKGEKPPVAKE
jgi:hypothetical protein